MSTPFDEEIQLPYSLKPTEECSLDEVCIASMQITGDEKLFSFTITLALEWMNKLHTASTINVMKSLILLKARLQIRVCFSRLGSEPSLRGLKNILRLHINEVNCSEWEMISVPSSVWAIVTLNLHNYGSGRNLWGHLKPDYLGKRGFLEAHIDDGLLEIFGLKQGWHASFVMVELISAKHIPKAAAIRLEVRGGEWKNAYMQMDGEPWKQLLSQDYSNLYRDQEGSLSVAHDPGRITSYLLFVSESD